MLGLNKYHNTTHEFVIKCPRFDNFQTINRVVFTYSCIKHYNLICNKTFQLISDSSTDLTTVIVLPPMTVIALLFNI